MGKTAKAVQTGLRQSDGTTGGGRETIIRALSALGFSDVEALVYATLLRFPGVTAYRVAKLVGKSQANVSLALRGLVAKRAVVAGDEAPTTFDPISVRALVSQLKSEFGGRIEAASSALENVVVESQVDRIRRLVSIEDVYAQAEQMLKKASETAIFSMTSLPLAHLRQNIARCAKKVSVVGHFITDEEPIAGVKDLRSRRGKSIRSLIEGELIILITDAREMLLCFSEVDGRIRQAVWANNPLLVVIMHNAITSDFILNSSRLADRVGSPNEYLFGKIPSAILEAFTGQLHPPGRS